MMEPETGTLSEREERFGEIVFEYLQAQEQGREVAAQEWLARYPDFASELGAFFANQQDVDQLAAPLRALVQSASANDSAPAAHDQTLPEPSTSTGEAGPRSYGDYEIIERIAGGGMGVVYKARQKGLNRLVALKVLRAGELAADTEIQRFRNEAETVALLDHPNIVPIYGVGEAHGRVYFSMKLIEGSNLSARANRMPGADRQGQRWAAQIVAKAARAIHYAHQRGVLHRDLKPSNILLDGDDQPHITDFGLAKRLTIDTELSQTGALIGTPSYMSPEQATSLKAAVTTATDVHGLGAILYALLTGRPPFQGDGLLQTLEQVKHQVPKEPRQHNPHIDPDLQTICLKCLQKEPVHRYAS